MSRDSKFLTVTAFLIAASFLMSVYITNFEFGKLAGLVSENSVLRMQRDDLAKTVLKQQAVILQLLQERQKRVTGTFAKTSEL